MAIPQDVNKIEDLAARSVALIQRTVDGLRQIPEFSISSTLLQPSQLPTTPTEDSITKLQLYTLLVEKDSSLIESILLLQEELKSFDGCSIFESQLYDQTTSNNERHLLVRNILLPSVRLLCQCYKILDSLTTVETLSPQTTTSRSDKTRQKHDKPPPPVGMLSLQNYTDIAAILELCVCTSILPQLDDNVLMSVEDRSRYTIPKSVAGRLPRRALLWGTRYYNSFGVNQEQPQLQSAKLDEGRFTELYKTVHILTDFLLLDRFCPMLLPRHLPDLYAAFWQVDVLQGKMNTETVTVRRYVENIIAYNMKLRQTLFSKIDARSQARTYQKLLSQGTKAPIWLKQTASQHLESLAQTDLDALIHIFVTNAVTSSSHSVDASAAASRLAHALLMTKKSHHCLDYYSKISVQLVRILDMTSAAIWTGDVIPSCIQVPAESNANLLSVRIMLDMMPRDVLIDTFLPLCCSTLIHLSKEAYALDSTIRRIATLFLLIPEACQTDTMTRFVFANVYKKDNETRSFFCVWGQLLRLASTATVLQSFTKDLVYWILKRSLHAISCERIAYNKQHTESKYVIALSVLLAVSPSQWDIDGHSFRLENNNERSFWSIYLEDITRNIDFLVRQVEERIVVIAKKLLSADTMDSEDITNNSSNPIATLPFLLLKLLLGMYFSSSNDSKSSSSLRALFSSEESYMLSLSSLPVLCENFSIDNLLFATTGSEGLFELMKLVFMKVNDKINTLESSDSVSSDIMKNDAEIERSIFYLRNTIKLPKTNKEVDFIISDDMTAENAMSEILWPVASVLLSLLVAILELGSDKRSENEEVVLQSLVPFLEGISRPSFELTNDQELSRCRSEIAEIASYAATLIISRQSLKGNSSTLDNKISLRPIDDVIERAKKDLQSSEPPLRARGIVSLRQLIHYIEGDTDGGGDTKFRVLRDRSVLYDRILEVAIEGLADAESYVYLACIHTIVAVVVVSTFECFWSLGVAVACGAFKYGDTNKLQLSAEQRIKLADALILSIQRKSVLNTTSNLLDLFLFGAFEQESVELTNVDNVLIQVATRKYFSIDDDSIHLEQSVTDKQQEETLRLKTGGPLFASEESDVLRAASICVIAELIAHTSPSICVPYCLPVIECASNILRSENSRPLCRAAALLARELYSVLCSELKEVQEALSLGNDVRCEMAVSMVNSNERALQDQLELYTKQVNTSEFNDKKATNYDAATIARCQEALQYRNEASEAGLFHVADLLISRNANSASSTISTLLKKKNETDSPAFLARPTLIQTLKPDQHIVNK